MSFATVRTTELDFADDTVIFSEATDVFEGAFDSLSEEAEPHGLRVPLDEDQGPGVRCILGATVESVPVNRENVEVTQTFTNLGSVMHSCTSCEHVSQLLGRRCRRCVALPMIVQNDEGSSLSLAGLPGLAVFL